MSSEGAGPLTGEQDQQSGLVPELRFPGFNGVWHHTELTPHLEEHSERVPSTTSIPIYSSTRSGLKPQNEYFDGSNLANDGEYRIVPKGYFTFRHMSDDGTFKFNVNDTLDAIAVSKEYPVFKAVGLSPKFLHYILNNSADFARFALMQKKGGTRTRLYLSTLRTWTPLLPSISEQQKIADCLSSIDALIAAEAGRLDAMKDHKRGLMQQLFPAPGETTPRLRFPEFQDSGEWEEKEVGDIFTVTRGNVLAMTLVEDVPTDRKPYPVYSSQTKRAGLAGYYSDFLYENAITWTTDGANAGDVNYRAGKFYCTNVCGVLISRDGYANACVAAIINSVSKSHVSYVGNPKLMNGVMAKIMVPLPSVEEQAKIALCLSSADALITAQGNKIDILKVHKRGLMQQLFPVADEVQA